VVVGSTFVENKLISLFLLKYLWSECERMGKPRDNGQPRELGETTHNGL